jgi:hypothetical protein
MLLAQYLSELLAEHLMTGTPPEILRPFLPDRFPPSDSAATQEQADYYTRYASGRT